jgi:peptide/nickel transport system substrate-binding protein
VNIRKAISLAINREELVTYVLDGAGIPASTYLNPNIPGHDSSLGVYEYDPELAKQYLADAGYPDGLTLDGGEVRQSEQAIAEAVQGYLSEVGINFVFDVVDNATWNTDRSSGKLPFTFITWNALYPDADFQVYNYFYSTYSDGKSVHYNNPTFDALMDQARAATDEEERAELYTQADQILAQEDMVCVPLYYPQSQFLAKPYVQNMKVGNLIYHLWNVDIDPAAQAAYNG